MKKSYIALLAVCIMLLSSTGWAATVFVDAANTSGLELGTEASPFNTIVEGVEAAAPGDTVLVSRGLYYGQVLLHPSVNIISKDGPEVTIINGMGAWGVVRAESVSGANLEVQGFTITDGGAGIYSYNSVYVTCRNCIVRDCSYGVYAGQRGPITVYNTVITNVSSGAVMTMWNVGLRLYNVTIDGAPLAGWAYMTPIRLHNTLITNVGNVFSLAGSPAIVGSYDNIWNYGSLFAPGADQSRYWLTDIISYDPLFVSAPTNYRLKSGSPLIDAGMDVGLPYVGAAPEIGAYEYTQLTIPEQMNELASSIANAPADIFRNPSEQRQDALYKKVEAVLRMVFSRDNGTNATDRVRVLNGCLSKLQNDILQKTDGNNGGNPDNDWISDSAEKTEFYTNIMSLIGTIQEEINTLRAQ